MDWNLLRKSPVATTVLVPAIVWLATKYGFKMDEATASYIAGGLLFVLGALARQFYATPVANPHDNDGRELVPKR